MLPFLIANAQLAPIPDIPESPIEPIPQSVQTDKSQQSAAVQTTAKKLRVPAPPERFSPLADAKSLPEPPPKSSTTPSTQSVPETPLELVSQRSPNPNTDRLIQPQTLPEPVKTQPQLKAPKSEVETPKQPVSPELENVTIQSINISGSTVFSNAELNAAVQPWQGKPLTRENTQAIVNAITEKYQTQGYLTSRAILIDPIAKTGNLTVQILEGSLERIDVEGLKRLNPNYVRSRIALGSGTPLNSAKLEDQLRLLRLDPLFETIEASLRAGTKSGQSILTVRVKEASAWNGGIGVDNYSPPTVGSERITTNLGHRNLTGNGDELGGFYNRTTNGGAESVGISYKIPVNAMQGTVQVRAEGSRYEVKQAPFDVLGIRGNSSLYEISYRQPVIRTPREELALSLGFTYQDGQTFTFNTLPTPFGLGPDANGVSRTSVVKFGQEYLKRDNQGSWAFRSQFNLGTGLFNATQNAGNIPDGQFFSWNGQAQRVQRMGANHLLIAQLDAQLTPDSLLPGQQFVIGGGQSVRGYRQNARSGDNGVRASLEDRITIQRDKDGNSSLQLVPFIDAGAVWNHPNNPNLQPSQTALVSAGLGVIWNPVKNLTVRVDYGLPIVSLSDRGNNAQDQGLHFGINYQF